MIKNNVKKDNKVFNNFQQDNKIYQSDISNNSNNIQKEYGQNSIYYDVFVNHNNIQNLIGSYGQNSTLVEEFNVNNSSSKITDFIDVNSLYNKYKGTYCDKIDKSKCIIDNKHYKLYKDILLENGINVTDDEIVGCEYGSVVLKCGLILNIRTNEKWIYKIENLNDDINYFTSSSDLKSLKFCIDKKENIGRVMNDGQKYPVSIFGEEKELLPSQ